MCVRYSHLQRARPAPSACPASLRARIAKPASSRTRIRPRRAIVRLLDVVCMLPPAAVRSLLAVAFPAPSCQALLFTLAVCVAECEPGRFNSLLGKRDCAVRSAINPTLSLFMRLKVVPFRYSCWQECEAGKFAATKGQASCIPCPKGSHGTQSSVLLSQFSSSLKPVFVVCLESVRPLTSRF